MSGPFRVIVADPPWQLRDKLPGPGRGASKHYSTMSLQELMRFPLPDAEDDAVLFLWRLASMQSEGIELAKAWAYTPKTEIVWRKTTSTGKRHFGMGHYVRAEHETCLISTRGAAAGLVKSRSIRSVFDGQVGRHSAKPSAFYDMVEQLFDGPYCELFARRQRAGWTCIGNELPEVA